MDQNKPKRNYIRRKKCLADSIAQIRQTYEFIRAISGPNFPHIDIIKESDSHARLIEAVCWSPHFRMTGEDYSNIMKAKTTELCQALIKQYISPNDLNELGKAHFKTMQAISLNRPVTPQPTPIITPTPTPPSPIVNAALSPGSAPTPGGLIDLLEQPEIQFDVPSPAPETNNSGLSVPFPQINYKSNVAQSLPRLETNYFTMNTFSDDEMLFTTNKPESEFSHTDYSEFFLFSNFND